MYRKVKEVLSPTLTIKVVGLFLGGLKLYILNKMKDTILNGKKNNKYYHTILNKNRFNMNIRLSSSLANSTRILYKNNFFSCCNIQQRFYHISNIKAINRIGPHNIDCFSVIIGSLLGHSKMKRLVEGSMLVVRESNKEYAQ